MGLVDKISRGSKQTAPNFTQNYWRFGFANLHFTNSAAKEFLPSKSNFETDALRFNPNSQLFSRNELQLKTQRESII